MHKNRILIMLAVLVILLVSCSNEDIQTKATEEILITEVATPTLNPTDTPIPTPTSTPEPSKPKYIFIVIGDGFGRGAMTLGEIYTRIENEDMQKGAAWENFEYQSFVTAMGESASGGTAIASGVETEPSYIGYDIDGNMLYTIMDRAKENGMGTGVVSNASITDATPATFMSHVMNRYGMSAISLSILSSNVDYIAGGGMGAIISPYYANTFGKIDSMGYTPEYKGDGQIVSSLEELGYDMFFGMEGALKMQQQISENSFASEKSIGLYTGGMMPYQYYKYQSSNTALYENIPSLVDLTEAGIQSLGNNPNGFVMMIEEALIDKSGHRFNQEAYIYEVVELNKVLNHIMEFYSEHPYETLVVLTADHENGNFAYDDEQLDIWKALPRFVWTDDGNNAAQAINEQWGLRAYGPLLQTLINKANADKWNDLSEDRAIVYNAITMEVCKVYGTSIRTAKHSAQPVPLYAMGIGSQEFEGSEHIKEIPITICEIMGWEALPEILIEDK